MKTSRKEVKLIEIIGFVNTKVCLFHGVGRLHCSSFALLTETKIIIWSLLGVKDKQLINANG